ncbi:MAG: phosphate ABC transporter substrate-binding protein [Desulfobacteraceae bacterium]|nr:phosphate ABC transporter substrate-binding protein [Desulfobacteraceae bacterium]MCK5542324.1 phosphate ABC transporter substrate-binding protein [Desulfobacterales bacterium]
MKYLIKSIIYLLFIAISASSLIAGELTIKGSTTVLPIAQKCAEAYMAANPDVKITLSGGGSGNGIKAIVDGTADIGNSSRFIKGKEIKLAQSKDIYPVPFRVALDCIAPVVNPSNKVSKLTMDQLKNIYLGNIKNWKEVGGKDAKIVVISRDSSSGTFEVWKKLVMNKERVMPGALTIPSNGAVVQAISKTPGAIGYIGLGYNSKDIKTVKINNVEPTEANTLNGTFPITRPMFMFTNNWPKGDTMGFIAFVLSKEGQKLVTEAGSIPIF